MTRLHFILALLVLHSLSLLLPVLLAAGAEGAPAAENRVAFLAALEGPWVGEARRTPIGPRPYNITFVRTTLGQVAGEAHPGASTHYWTFYEEEAALKLRFLSTFAGNQQPLVLTAMAEQGGRVVFQAPQPGFLEVHAQPQPDTLTIQVFLRGKSHVEIHLTRRS
jgi:hypothetical protein